MKRNLLIIVGVWAVAVLLACGKPADAARATAAPGTAHAAAGVEPGSHEDWCGEHEVPESACTRCNPTLIAAFKATGDWCAEHGLPESQCKACNPNLKIERPPEAAERTN
jgi:hypothetical protein